MADKESDHSPQHRCTLDQSAKSCLLAQNALNWVVLQLPNGLVQVDLVLTAILLNPNELDQFTTLLCDAVRATRDNPNLHGDAARQSETRLVWYCNVHKFFTILFDRAVLRLYPDDFNALTQLVSVGCGELIEQQYRQPEAMWPRTNLPPMTNGFSMN
jgi:hypothetical protein